MNYVIHVNIILIFITLFYIFIFYVIFLKNEEDLPYEEEILRNPYSVKHWQRYIDHLKSTKSNNLNIVYERALKELPGR